MSRRVLRLCVLAGLLFALPFLVLMLMRAQAILIAERILDTLRELARVAKSYP